MYAASYPLCFNEHGLYEICDETNNLNYALYPPSMPHSPIVRPPMAKQPIVRPPMAKQPIVRPPMAHPSMRPPSVQGMTDDLAKRVEAEWKKAFPDAAILPVIGYPSKGNGVMTLTHSMGNQMPKMKINGLTSLSPLANNALYSAELTGGKWLNLYEIMIPDISPGNGAKSTGEIYVETLAKQGILVQGDHYHWKSSDPFMLAIHSKGLNMHPVEFTRRQIAALKEVMQNMPH